MLVWRRNVGTAAHAKPTLAGEHIYLPGSDSRVMALRVDTGAPSWERRLGGAANDILVSGDRLFVGSQDKYMYCLNAEDGVVEWRWRTGGPVIGVPVVDERTAFFVSLDNVLER
jgi:outer membrane protein assembly factor BamB